MSAQITTHPATLRPTVVGNDSAAQWILPGKPIYLAHGTAMGVQFNHDANGKPLLNTYKFWCSGTRIADLQTNNGQLDLRTSLQIIITELCHRNNPTTGAREATLVEVAHVPFAMIARDLDGAA